MNITIKRKENWKDRMKVKTGIPIKDNVPELSEQITTGMFKYPLYSDKDLQVNKPVKAIEDKKVSERAPASEGTPEDKKGVDDPK